MELSLLKDLLPIMRNCGVSAFEFEGLKLAFQATGAPVAVTQQVNPLITQLQTLAKQAKAEAESLPQGEKQEAGQFVDVPQSLDAEIPFDKILHWSGSADEDQAPVSVPLTDDLPLGDVEIQIPEPELGNG